MYEIRCDKCGYYAEDKFIKHTNCPNCGYSLIIDNINDEDIPNLIDHESKDIENYKELFISGMIINIDTEGNDKTWYKIEKQSLSMRLFLRKIFFEVGGQVPKREDIEI